MISVRLVAFIILASQLGMALSEPRANHPLLVVVATTNVSNDLAAALDVRDLEHFVVAELIRRRVEIVVPSTSAEGLTTG